VYAILQHIIYFCFVARYAWNYLFSVIKIWNILYRICYVLNTIHMIQSMLLGK